MGLDEGALIEAIKNDHAGSGLKSLPKCLIGSQSFAANQRSGGTKKTKKNHASRQSRH